MSGVQAALASAADGAAAESKRDVKTHEAGNQSGSDVEVDSPFASRGSLPSKEVSLFSIACKPMRDSPLLPLTYTADA